MIIKTYTDISVCKAIIGVGVCVELPSLAPDRMYTIGVPIKPGLTTTEAELYGLLVGSDVVESLINTHGFKEVEAHFFTDCESAIGALYKLGRVRSQATKNLAAQILKALDSRYPENWSIQPVKSKDNPANEVAKATRRRWSSIWKAPERSSGQ